MRDSVEITSPKEKSSYYFLTKYETLAKYEIGLITAERESCLRYEKKTTLKNNPWNS